jgi:hypothetical protein
MFFGYFYICFNIFYDIMKNIDFIPFGIIVFMFILYVFIVIFKIGNLVYLWTLLPLLILIIVVLKNE